MSRRLKRSRMIIIVPMSAVILIASGCQMEQQPRIYTSVQECVQDKLYKDEDCFRKYQAATQWHQNNAPQFRRREDCENTYGVNNCQSWTRSGALYYIPLMRGYALSNKINQPIYGSSSQGYRSSTGIYLGSQTKTKISPSRLGGKTSPKGSVTRGNYGRGSSRGG